MSDRPGVPPGDAAPAQFAFLVPFKPRSAAADWDAAQANLRRTVRSALSAGKPHGALVVVACHDEPELGDVAPEDVTICAAPFPEPEDARQGGRDKARKRRLAAAHLRRHVHDGGEIQVMFLDADDLVHRDTVAHVLSSGAGSHVVERGYILDRASGLVWRRRESFFRHCGSSFVCCFGRDELPDSWDDLAAPFSMFGASPDQRGHQEYDAVAVELGRPPEAFPFAAVMYLVNHGESLWTAREGVARTSGGLQDPRPGDIVAASTARRLVAGEFSSPDLARDLAGPGVVARTRTRRAAGRLRRRVLLA